MANSLYGATRSRRVTVTDLQSAKGRGERWPMLTSYDAMTARVFDDAGVPVLLVGDSAAMVVYGHDTTIPVTMDDLLPLVAGVVRGSRTAMVVADMPFASYQGSPAQALDSAARFMKEAGAHAVKLEGGQRVAPQIELLADSGVPVMGHLGLTPQSVHALGGYRVQGRGESGQRLLQEAKLLQDAGVFSLVLEVVPAELAAEVTASLDIPVIGIGAGAACDAQVLVWQDLMGLSPDRGAKFVRQYHDLYRTMREAVTSWGDDVASGAYPDEDHLYH
jgi:3-methyl-2-oxobutanoate hydroxymethyltransferase